MKRLTRISAIVLAGTAFAACGGSGGGGSGGDGDAAGRSYDAPIGGESGTELAEEQVLHVGNGAEPHSIDPHKGRGVPGSNIQRDLYEGLVSESPDAEVIPGGATDWTLSDDGLNYTFELREDARWSNGDAVTADDYVYGLRRALDPETASEYTFLLEPIENAGEIAAGEMPREALGARAVDDYTLEITLEDPTPYFLQLLTHPVSFPGHRPSMEEHGDRHTRPGNIVTNGAFELDEWVPQSHIKLVRNERYWDNESTTLEEVWFYPTENQTSEFQRYRAGELDVTESVPKSQMDWIREHMPEELRISPYLGTYYFGFNLTQPPFEGSPELRRALSLAIDRRIIVEQVTNAGEIPAFGWVPPRVANYDGQRMEEASWTQEEREAEAQRLYEEAGYGPDNPLEVELLYNTQENHRRIAIAIAAMWDQELGVDANILNQEWKVFLDTRQQKQTEVFRAGWIGDYNDPYTFAELFHSEAGLNNTGYANEAYDRQLERAQAETDLEARAEHLKRAERMLIEDMALLPVYYYSTARLVAPYVGGFESNVMDRRYHKRYRILKH